MFSLIFATLALQANDPEYPTVICQPHGQVEERTLRLSGFQCAGETVPDPEGLQAYLNAVQALTPETIELPRTHQVSFNDNIEVIYDGEQWQFPAPTVITRSPADYPRRALQRRVSGRCAIRFSLSEAGVATQTGIACEQFISRSTRASTLFQDAAQAAFDRYVWLPLPGQEMRCSTIVIDFLLSQHESPEGEVLNAPTCPDTH